MRSLLAALAGVVFLFAVPVAALAAPLEAYGRLPSIEAVSVSPSGHAVVVVVTNGEQRSILVKDLATGKFTSRVDAGTVKIRHVQWAGDTHLLFVSSVTAAPLDLVDGQREWLKASAFDLKTRKFAPVLGDIDYTMNAIFDYPVVRMYRGEPAVFVQGMKFDTEGYGLLSLYRYNLQTGKSRLVAEGFHETRDWVVGPEGEPAAQETYNANTGRWTLKVRQGGGWRDAQTVTAPLDRPYVMGLGRDGKSVLFAIGDADGDWSWREARLDGAAAKDPLPIADDQRPLRDPQDGRLIGHTVLDGDEGRYTFFDPIDDKVWKAVVAAFPGDAVQLESWSSDRRKIVVRVDSPTEGPAYALVDMNTGKADWLGAEYVGLKKADISPKEAIRFRAADGLALSGYLTLPRGRAAKDLPLIVFPHGGPASRDEPGFDWWAQGMASRGYAVLQVNFRGSDGLGPELLTAGFGQWGRKMQSDLSDGVKHLAGQGVIDPRRVCIVGGSYGGYAALAGATLDRDVYRCAVSFAGVSDLRRLVAEGAGRGAQATGRYWNRFIGVAEGGDALLTRYSPLQQAANASIPILLIHGQDDTVVPMEHSRLMADALRKAGKPVELIVQKGEDHHLSRGETRLQMLTASMAFIEKHNPPN